MHRLSIPVFIITVIIINANVSSTDAPDSGAPTLKRIVYDSVSMETGPVSFESVPFRSVPNRMGTEETVDPSDVKGT